MTTTRPKETEPRPSSPPATAADQGAAAAKPAALAASEPCDPQLGVIVVRVQEFTQLFNSLDPSPFLERDLDDDLVDYITSWAREIPPDRPLRLQVQLRQQPQHKDDAQLLRTAIHNQFANSAQLKRNEFRQLMRRGRLSLAIGLGVLGTAAIASELVELAGDEPLLQFLRDGLIIGGWVAMWRPLEILLYDWWPVRAEQKLHERLRDAELDIRVVPAGPADVPAVPE
jgi:hypothetical protein